MMTGEKEFIKIYEYIKTNSKFDKFDVIIDAFDRKLTRFANSVIHQNVAEKNFSVLLRGVLPGSDSSVSPLWRYCGRRNDHNDPGLRISYEVPS